MPVVVVVNAGLAARVGEARQEPAADDIAAVSRWRGRYGCEAPLPSTLSVAAPEQADAGRIPRGVVLDGGELSMPPVFS